MHTQWIIREIERDANSNQVEKFFVEIRTQEDTILVREQKIIPVTPGTITTPFENLTEEQCVLIVKDILGEVEVQAIEDRLHGKFQSRANQNKVRGRPWIREEEPDEIPVPEEEPQP